MWCDMTAHEYVTNLENENKELKKALTLISSQYLGCGGNLTPDEIWKSMKQIADTTLDKCTT